ncbi:MAG: SUMF1/EgtB/PvdO family nonheme iron enzyme, partial [Caldilineaceae bacterium]|nr:SUMF1/EgtB/PvdO family nonheme iron enzyme [Caldilineaceae bacterium]
PTEAEWEKAARSDDERIFPWLGEATDDDLLNFNAQSTVAVGSFPAGASPYGLLDMAGNVEEWVNDWYSPTYYAESPPANPPGPSNGFFRVVRGGSFVSNRGMVRTTARGRAVPDSTFPTVGFRVLLPTITE